MNTLKNRVQLVGHLGTNPEVKHLESGKKVAKLVVATNDTYKNKKSENITETTWHYLTAWGTLANFAEKYLKKGDEIMLEGKLKNSHYTDKEGVKHYVTEIVVNEWITLGKKKS